MSRILTTERLTIGPAAKYIGKSVETLRRWELEGRLIPVERNNRGQRLYTRDQLRQLVESSGSPNSRETLGPAPSRDVPGGWVDDTLDPGLRELWNQARCYILKATTEPIPEQPENPWFDPDQPWHYIWYPEASDRCAEMCERRVRRYLFPGVTLADLRRIVNRTVEHFVEEERDRRLRAELLADGVDPDEWD